MSVSLLFSVGVVMAARGEILLLSAICLIIGAQKVSDTFMLLSTL